MASALIEMTAREAVKAIIAHFFPGMDQSRLSPGAVLVLAINGDTVDADAAVAIRIQESVENSSGDTMTGGRRGG